MWLSSGEEVKISRRSLGLSSRNGEVILSDNMKYLPNFFRLTFILLSMYWNWRGDFQASIASLTVAVVYGEVR